MAQSSTDGGVVLLKALDARLQLTEGLAACLPDRRDPSKVQHEIQDLVRQRVFGLACGYEDGNDAARLADDAMHKLAVGRDPLTGASLASQPTLSRRENAVGPSALEPANQGRSRHSARATGQGARWGVPAETRFHRPRPIASSSAS